VLAGSGFGDDAVFPHATGEQRLSDAVVDLVGAGVEEVLALEVDLCAAQLLRQAFGEEQWRGPAGVFVQQAEVLFAKRLVFTRLGVGGFELLQRGHEGFGDVASTVRAEAAFGVLWHGLCCPGLKPPPHYDGLFPRPKGRGFHRGALRERRR
jgi:hypothetical protein